MTQDAQKYGFHATLKAPFRLPEKVTQVSLEMALKQFAQTRAPAQIERLRLDDRGGFLALRPIGDLDEINALAADVTRHFEPYRAPLNTPEIKKRLRAGLTERQTENLHKWGYPYVMEDFAFHMTLTGQINSDIADVLISEIEPMLMHLVPAPMMVDALTLMGEDLTGMFHQIERFPLLG